MSDVSQTQIEEWLVAYAARHGVGGGPRATFHAMGLDSLATTAMFDALSGVLGRRVSPTLAWDHPTPAALARHLTGGSTPESDRATRATRAIDRDAPIAIVGMACRLPGAPSPAALWDALCEGRDCTGPVPPGRWATWQAASPTGVEPVRRGGFLDDVAGFDAAFFGISPREAAQVDPQQRLMLELTWEALEDAGLDPTGLRGRPVGVFTGLVWRDYADLQSAVAARHSLHTCVGHAGSIAANRVSYAFGFEGPSVAFDTACSSALVAVHTACESLRRGESELALAGGVQLNLSPRTASAVSAFGALAPDGRCKTFAAAADGYGRGEGAGLVVLKPLALAERDGDVIHAVILGSAVNNDGASNGITAPNPAAQRRLLRAAYGRAGVEPSAAHYVELHGTGTPLGDPIEAGALGAVLGAGRSPDRALRVGSIKSNVGHLEAAAGIAGLLKLALCLRHRALPPSIHFDAPNPHIDFEGLGLRMQTGLTPWPEPEARPIGGVSSFGFGGTNCHVVLAGEPAPPTPPVPEVRWASRPRVVFVFAGAGTPRPDLRALLRTEPAFRAVFERCDALVRARAGWSLIEVALDGPEEEVRRGRYQLPINLAFGLAMCARWRARGVEPDAVIGYSVGEWAAACAAGAITLEEAFTVALAYVEVQQAVDGRAAMGVVGRPAAEVQPLIAPFDGDLAVSAFNGPGSTGIGGTPEAVQAFVDRLADEGAFARTVRIDFFAHIPQAVPLAMDLRDRLDGRVAGRPTRVPFVSTVRGAPTPGEALDAGYWAANLAEPVRFDRAVAALRADGPCLWLDVNAHPIHGPAIAENLPGDEGKRCVVASAARGEDPRAALAAAEARLAQAGIEAIERSAPIPVVLSARDDDALRARARAVAETTADLAPLAAALALRGAHHPHRLALVARERADLDRRLRAFAAGEAGDWITGRPQAEGGVVWVFTGQGTQWPGMGRDLLAAHPVFRAAFHDFARAVRRCSALDVVDLLERADGDILGRTAWVQPLLTGVQIALAAVLRDAGPTPTAIVGHSLGELAAAHVAGALDLDAVARLVVARGRAMATAPVTGGMCIVDADRPTIDRVLAEAPEVTIAVLNGPRAHVLAGPLEALGRVEDRLRSLDAAVTRLLGMKAFHSPLTDPAAEALLADLGGLGHGAPTAPIISTVTADDHADFGPAHWADHIRRAVRFSEAIERALDGGARVFVELGAHPALVGHIKRAAQARGGAAAVGLLAKGRPGSETLAEAFAALFVAGAPIDWRRLHPEGAPALPLPAYPWQRQPHWFPHERRAAHPLLGARARRDGDRVRYDESVASDRPALLGDHAVHGAVVVAGATFASMAIDVGARLRSEGAIVADGLTFHTPLTLGPDTRRRLSTTRADDGRFAVASLDDGARPVTHADGGLRRRIVERRPPVDLAAIRSRCAEGPDGPAFYAVAAEHGLTLGPRFRWVERAWIGEDEALVRLRAPTADDDAAHFHVAPGLVDACFQSALVLPGNAPAPGVATVALGVERLTWWPRAGAPAWCHARWHGEGPRGPTRRVDLTVCAADGAVVGRFDGFAVARASRASLVAAARALIERWAPVDLEPGRLSGRWRILNADPADRAAIAQALKAAGADADFAEDGAPQADRYSGVLDVGGLSDPLDGPAAPAIEAALASVRATVALDGPPTVWLTRGAVAVDPDAVVSAAAAGRWGLAHTASYEHPESGWRLIDVGPADAVPWGAVAAALADEAHRRIALRGGAWRAPTVRVAEPAAPMAVRGGWLLTGGTGALGLRVAAHLAERGATALTLLARRAPGAEARAVIERIEAGGCAVRAVEGDVARAEDVERAVKTLSEAPLRGVVHAAGVVADGILIEQDAERIARALRPKLDGARLLDAAVGDRPLDAFVLFGSVAAALGSPGQGPYAAANAALAAVVGARRARGRVATLIDWGPWADGGMASAVSRRGSQDQLGLAGLDPDAGIEAFDQALSGGEARRLVLAPGSRPRVRFAFDRALARALGVEVKADAPAPTPSDLGGAVRAVVRAVLGLGPDDEIDPTRPLQALGLDSLMALEVRNRLGDALGRALPATLLFDHPTIEALIAALAPAAEAVAEPITPPVEAGGQDVAIVGMACRLPGGVEAPDDLWRLLMDGRVGIRPVPADRWDIDAWYDPDPAAPGKMVSREGGFIDGIDQFDAGFFSIAAAEARSIDPQQRLLLELTWEALERAGLRASDLRGRRVGVFLGIALSEYGLLELNAPDPRGINAWSGQGAVLSIAAGRIAYAFGFEGPALAIDTACSSSLVATHLATRSLRRGECDVAIIAGSNLLISPRMSVYFTKMQALSPDSRCRAFSADANGYVRGEGLGVVVAQRLADAQAGGQRIVARIRGTAINQDGRSAGLTAPSGPAQSRVVRAALRDAGLRPDDVDYVECHGTGTPLGDPIEVNALSAVFGGRAAPLGIGTIKSNIGHLEAAAGIAALMKATLAVERGELPASLHAEALNPHIDWDAADIEVVRRARPWTAATRTAGMSSFGFSGTNAHVIVSSADPAPAPLETAPPGPLLVPLSARDPDALPAIARRLLDALPGADLRAMARTAIHRRTHHRHRWAFVAADAAEAADRLRDLLRGVDDPRIFRGRAKVGASGAPRGSDPAALGRAWVAGAKLDWAAILDPAGPWADLPTYPWRHRRYWVEAPASLDAVTDAAPRAHADAPPYGRRLLSALPGWQFEARHGDTPLLDDHRTHGRRVVAGAHHIAATLSAARSVGLDAAFEGVAFVRPLTVPDDDAVVAHTTLIPDGAGHRVRIASLPPGSTTGWRTHVEGRLAPRAAPTAPPRPLAELRAACTEPVDAAALMGDPGLGPRFKWLVGLHRGPGWVVGDLPAGTDPLPGLRIHPGLLDSAFRTIKALDGSPFAATDALIPLSVERVALGCDAVPEAGTIRVAARLRPGRAPDARTIEADLWLFDDGDRLLASVEGLVARTAVADDMFIAGVDPVGACHHRELVPFETPTPAARPRAFALVGGDDAAERLRAGLVEAGHGVVSAFDDATDVIDLRPLAGGSLAAVTEALLLARDLAAAETPPRLTVLTRGATATDDPAAAPADPYAAALWGAMPGLSREAPALGARLVDLPHETLDDRLIRLLAAETPGEDRLVLGHDGPRALRLAVTPRRALAADPPPTHGTWVISGGLGGLGRALAAGLVERGVAGLLLLGRRPPDVAAQARIDRWRAAGVAVRTAQVDVTDRPALDAALAAARAAMPPIVGVIHAAGVLGDAPLTDLSAERARAVLAPKVDGALALDAATAADPIEAFVMLSSLAAVVGNAGQIAYGAANGALDGLAARRRARGAPGLSLAFGPWTGVGMVGDEAQRRRFEQIGIESLPASEGVALFNRLAGVDRATLVVGRVNWRRWAEAQGVRPPLLARLLDARPDAPELAAAPASPLDPARLAAAAPAARAGLIAEGVRSAVTAILELDGPPDDDHLPLVELGFDSFFAVRLRGRFERLGIDIPMGRLLGEASVASLAADIAERWAPPAALAGPAPSAEADAHAPFPLTDIQQAYLVGRTGAYALGGVACHLYHEFDGPDRDPARLEAAWRAVIDRHPALRTVRLPDGRQRLLEETPDWTLPVHDLRDADAEVRDAALDATRARLSTRCAPTGSWPSFAIEASRLPGDRMRVHVDFDLIGIDAAGMLTTLSEWQALYTDPAAALPRPPDTFRAAVLREHAARQSTRYRDDEAWWSQRLDTLPPPPELPLACAPASLDAPAFERHGIAVDAERWSALGRQAAALGLTPTHTLAAIFAEVLAAWSGQRPFTVALTLFRPPLDHPDADRVVGEFTTTALLEVDPAAPTFVERARALRDRLAEDLEHIACSGVAAQRAHARRTGRFRHFPVVLTSVVGRAHVDRADRLDWLGDVVHAISQTPQVWIDNQIVPHRGGVRMSWDVPRGLFPPGMIAAAFAASARLVARLAADADAWHTPRFDLLPPDQAARRAAYNATEAPRRQRRLFDDIRDQVDAAPHRIAVIGPHETLDYATLDARANQLTHALAGHAIAPGDPVVVCVPRSALQVVAVLGVHGAGGAYVPVDPSWPAARVEDITARCGARVVVTTGAITDIRWPEGVAVVRADRVDDRPTTRRPAPQTPGDRAYIIHTSGSTGAPKGVVMNHAATLNTIDDINRRFAVGPDDRVLSVSSLAFDLSVYDLFGPLSVGAAVVVPAPERARDVHHWMDLIQRHRITLWNSVPALFELLVEVVERAGSAPGALRAVLLSGDWIPTDLPDRGRGCWPAARIHSLGGATEAAIWSIGHPTDALDPAAPSVPYGRPLDNQTIHVLDPRLKPSPEWVPGELYIGGVGLADGYWRDPQRTAERFVEHPRTGARLYRTGDTGRVLPAGHVEFLGRVDTQVKINGHRIELGEIEAALRSAPAVRDAVVEAPGDRHRRRLVAYVVPAPDAALRPADLQAHLAARLPAAMVPRAWVPIPAVPLTANGKVDRRALPDPPDAAPAPLEAPPATDDAALGRVLAVIGEVMPGLDVGPDDDLVRAGANSVDLIRLGTRLNESFGARPPMAEILRRGTPAALARFYGDAAAPTATPPAGPGPLPLIVDPDARAALKKQRLGLRPVTGVGQRLRRPPVDMAAYLDRRSQRRFVPDPVPRGALADWLAVLCPIELGGELRYRHGSAGATHPLRTYLSVAPGRVHGLAGGAWYHDPIGHRLIPVGDDPCPPEVHVVSNRPWAAEAPLLLFFVAERRAIEPIYGARWRDFALIELGARVQLLEDRALRCGLGACQIGELDFDAVAGLLDLGETERVLHAMGAGPVEIEDDEI